VSAIVYSLCQVAVVAIAVLAVPGGRQGEAVRLSVPLQKQPYNLCLPASVSMVLSYWGVEIAPERILEQVPIYKDGTTGEDLRRFVETLGFRGFLVQLPFEDLVQHLAKQRPIIVSLTAGRNLRHAMVLVGVDPAGRQVWLNDPASGEARRMPLEDFQKRFDASARWTFLIVPR
jgi:ABC-type bacteriocin/lantibiotic exporter with double-glycine peptidase domain